jgi:hypothetical protein
MPTTYTIEAAKSSRANCKKCKEKVVKGALRIGTHSQDSKDHTFSSWNHLECFVVPRKYKSEYTNEQFLEEMVEDQTDDNIMDSEEGKKDVVARMGSQADQKTNKKRDRDDASGSGALAAIKNNAALLQAQDEDGDGDDEPAPKKNKMSEMDQKLAQSYNKFASLKIANLQDILRWNKAPTTGKKDFLLIRVIDGDSRGRLPKCPSCIQGKLKVNDDGTKVVGTGFFNEESGGYEKCFMEMDLDKVDR